MGARFFEGYPWRFLFCDIPTDPDCAPPSPSPGGVTTTWANGLLHDRTVTYTLDQPSVITASVNPNDRQVNALFGDGDPLIAQGNRLLYAFRREGVSFVGTEQIGPWVCRAAGILMSPEDEGNVDLPLTHITAYDPWQYLAGRIVFIDILGTPVGEDGANAVVDFGPRADQLVLGVLRNTIKTSCFQGGGFCFLDAGDGSRSGEGDQYQDYGGTPFYKGTIEKCDDIAYQLQQGQMVKDVWDDVTDSGNLDIVLTPIYDPINRPGYTHEVSVYKIAGRNRYDAVFGWDRMNHAVGEIDRMHDGTPGSFANLVQYFAGSGGFPVARQTNDDALNKYLAYWATQTWSSQTVPDPTGTMVLQLAKQALRLAKQGRRTLTVDPSPERSPVALRDYLPGDLVPFYASNALRTPISSDFTDTPPSAFRVEGIPITITDDGIEEVQSLLVSPDFRTAT